MNLRESARAEYLHTAFTSIASAAANGEPVVAALRRLSRRRSRHISRGNYSFSQIRSLYYRWQANPTPVALARQWKGAKQKVPNALLLLFLDRIVQTEVVSAFSALQSLRLDWRRGIALPGIGSWTKHAGSRRSTPPPFPFGKSSFYARLGGGNGQAFQALVSAALRGQRDVRRLELFLDARRAALEQASKHDPIS